MSTIGSTTANHFAAHFSNASQASHGWPSSPPPPQNARRKTSLRPITPNTAPLAPTQEESEEEAEGSITISAPQTPDSPMSIVVRPLRRHERRMRSADSSLERRSHDTSEYDSEDYDDGTDNVFSAFSRSSSTFGPARGPILLKDPIPPPSEGSIASSSQPRQPESTYTSSCYDGSEDDDSQGGHNSSKEDKQHLFRLPSPLPKAHSTESISRQLSSTSVSSTSSSERRRKTTTSQESQQSSQSPLLSSLDEDSTSSLMRRVADLEANVVGGQVIPSQATTSLCTREGDAVSSISPHESMETEPSTSVSPPPLKTLADLTKKVAELEVLYRKSTAALPPLPPSPARSRSNTQSSVLARHRLERMKNALAAEDGTPLAMYTQTSGSSVTVTADWTSSSTSSLHHSHSRRLSASSLASSMFSYTSRPTNTAATSVRTAGPNGSDAEGEMKISSPLHPDSSSAMAPSFSTASFASSTSLPPILSQRSVVFNGPIEVMMDEEDRIFVRWGDKYVPLGNFFGQSPTLSEASLPTIQQDHTRPALSPLTHSRSAPPSTMMMTTTTQGSGRRNSRIFSSAASTSSLRSSGSTDSGVGGGTPTSPDSNSSQAGSGSGSGSGVGTDNGHGHGSGSGGLHSRSLAGAVMALPTKSSVERKQQLMEREERIKKENEKMGVFGPPKMKVGPGRGRMVVKGPKAIKQ